MAHSIRIRLLLFYLSLSVADESLGFNQSETANSWNEGDQNLISKILSEESSLTAEREEDNSGDMRSAEPFIPDILRAATKYHKRQFDPWGGKRGSTVGEEMLYNAAKRQFSPWGGKRALVEVHQFEDDGTFHPKRNFHAWGGKRNFNAWGGKRNFHAWGGKRNFNAWGGKRNFNAWGGKKRSDTWPEDDSLPGINDKRDFNAWGGKRSLIDSDDEGADALNEMMNSNRWENKRTFNAWGGKRSGIPQGENAWTLLVPKVQRNFNAWGGKRSPSFGVQIEGSDGDSADSLQEGAH